MTNTFPGTHPLGEEFFAGGAVADFTFFLSDPGGNPLRDPSGQPVRVGRQIVSGGKVTLDALPPDGRVLFRIRVSGVSAKAPFVQFSYSVDANVKAWSGNINEPPLPWRGACAVDFDIVWLAPRFVTESGEELPIGRVLTVTGEDVSAGYVPRGPLGVPVVSNGDTFGFEVSAEPGTRFGILQSSDLDVWTLLEEVEVPASGKVSVTSPLLPQESGRFYRAERRP